MPNEIVISPEVTDSQIEIAESAIVSRDNLLANAANITEVNDTFGKEAALTMRKKLKGDFKSVEDTRKELKAPLLALGKKIDKAAKEYQAPIEVEGKRIAGLLGEYEEQERKRIEAEEAERKRKIKEEQDRIREEERKKAFELKKKADEAAAKAASEEEAERIQAAAEVKARQDAEEAAARLKEVKKENTAIEKKGSNVRLTTTYHFEVENLEAFFAFHPELCDITPNNKAIKAALKEGKKLTAVKSWKTTEGS